MNIENLLDLLTLMFAVVCVATAPYLFRHKTIWLECEKNQTIRFSSFILAAYGAIYLLQLVVPIINFNSPWFQLILFGGFGCKQLVVVYLVMRKKHETKCTLKDIPA